ncbi:LuxR C-terminal-related transcriptional regulator [Neolewinella antarctica]|uniref:DNA-binding NarL/FixJ family response regulator n=1 Tax=Neolewinella antarctica TaxID=442734 RepID=A0ABX0X637_9BACT|nr:response regulator transcription factor [Neolewinella antarctica]NJC24676.1 DNA-binding NarL/FixJ family response regulator [Neolewinella antarctica]
MLCKTVATIGGTPLVHRGLETILRHHYNHLLFAPTLASLPAGTVPDLVVLLVPDRTRRTASLLEQVERADCKSIVAIGPYLRTLVISRAFRAGLSAYALRQTSAEQLKNAIVAAESGVRYTDPALERQWLDEQVYGHACTQQKTLTRRQREILQLIVEELTTDEIAQRLFLSRCTIESHRANLLTKLDVRNTAGLVREAMRLDLYKSPASHGNRT